ncbi:MAG: hypothetical protein ACE5HP_06255, partial [Gemmatimonadota bacterium]
RFRRGIGAILAAALLAGVFLTGPAPRRVEAAGCGGTDGTLCYQYTTCKRVWIIFRRCTTEYGYFPEWV